MTLRTITPPPVSIARPEDDTSFTIFGNQNNFRTSQVIIGGLFSFNSVLRFPGLGIPKAAKNISATLTLTPATTTAGAASININAAAQGLTAAWKPQAGFTGWRAPLWSRFKAFVRNSTGGTIINTVTASPGSFWSLKQETMLRQRLGESFIPPTDTTLGSIALRLRRFGSPSGDLTLQIMAADTSSPTQPDEVVLATSAIVAPSSVSTAAGGADVTFSFADQIELTGGQEYYMVLNTTGPVEPFNTLVWHYSGAFFSIGGARMYNSPAHGWDYGNYPDHGSCYFPTVAGNVGTDILWTLPAQTLGVPIVSPDIGPLIEELTDHVDYVHNDPFSLALKEIGAAAQRQWASFDHPTLAPAFLTYSYDIDVCELLADETDTLALTGSETPILALTGSEIDTLALTGSETPTLSLNASEVDTIALAADEEPC